MQNSIKYLITVIILCNQALTFTANKTHQPSRRAAMAQKVRTRLLTQQVNTNTIANSLAKETGLSLKIAQEEAVKINTFFSLRNENVNAFALSVTTDNYERKRWNKAFNVFETIIPEAQPFALLVRDQIQSLAFFDAVCDAPVDIVAHLKTYYDRHSIDVAQLTANGRNALEITQHVHSTGRCRSNMIQYLKNNVFVDAAKAQEDEEKLFKAQEEEENAPTQEEADFIKRMLGEESATQKSKKKKKKKKHAHAQEERAAQASREDH